MVEAGNPVHDHGVEKLLSQTPAEKRALNPNTQCRTALDQHEGFSKSPLNIWREPLLETHPPARDLLNPHISLGSARTYLDWVAVMELSLSYYVGETI